MQLHKKTTPNPMKLFNIPYPNFHPVAISIGPITIHWYGIAYVFSILVGYQLAKTFSKSLNIQLNLSDLVSNIILGIIIGGRLGYVLFYDFVEFLKQPYLIFAIWQGGMSFHGGFLGVLISGILFGMSKKISLLCLGDLIAFASPPGLFFGRIANFINGELWGKPTTSTFGIQFTKGQGKFCPSSNEIPCFRHPSQLYEAFFEGIVLMLIFYYLVFFYKALKKPGIIFGSFLLGYGVIRFSIEFLREPDSFFITNENPYGYVVEFFPGIGISMGQLLTIPMIIFGLLMIFLITKRNLDAN